VEFERTASLDRLLGAKRLVLKETNKHSPVGRSRDMRDCRAAVGEFRMQRG